MIRIRKIVFDVLKPHRPTGLEFATALAEKSPGSVVNVNVDAMDQNTESVVVRVEGEHLDFDAISEAIIEMGGSIHSVDEVEVIRLTKLDDNG
jgi:hypothetical protein